MNSRKYDAIVENFTPNENRLLNMLLAFFGGGMIGLLGNVIYDYFIQSYSEQLAISFMVLIIVALTSLVTALGFGDTLFKYFKCGLIIPTTGFAHSISSAILDYKKEGFLNMGSNSFKLAGSVILYGIVSAIVLTLLKVILNV